MDTTSINDLKKRVESINAQISDLSTKRSVALGKRQTFEGQLQKLKEDYEAKYGVALTDDNVDAELEKVSAEYNEWCEKMAHVLEAISKNEFTRANSFLGVEAPKETAKVEQPVSTPTADIMDTVPTVPTQVIETQVAPPSAPVASTPVPPTTVVPVATEEVVEPPNVPNEINSPNLKDELVAPITPQGVIDAGFVAPPPVAPNVPNVPNVPSLAVPPVVSQASANIQALIDAEEVDTAPPVAPPSIGGGNPAYAGFTKGVTPPKPPVEPSVVSRNFGDLLNQ